MKTILITGGAGNIGSAMAHKLAQNPDNTIIVVDNLSTGSLDKLPDMPNILFYEGDVNENETLVSIFRLHEIDIVFHYSAIVGVERTLLNPFLVFKDINGMHNILRMASLFKVERIFFSSSSEVYGEPIEHPQNEITTPLNARLPYAIVKNIGESLFNTYYREFGLPVTIFRFFNTYGPNQSDDFVVPRFVKKALFGEPITIYGDGSQTRSFCFVDDNIDACINIMNDSSSIGETFNIGSNLETSILDLALLIKGELNSNSPIVFKSALEEGDMMRRCANNEKMMKYLKRDLTPIRDGINKLAHHYAEVYG